MNNKAFGITTGRGWLVALLLAACGTSEDPAPQSRACLDQAHVTYVVELVGTAFTEEEGRRVHAITDVELAEPAALGTSCRIADSTEVAGAAFEITLANLTDTAVYPFIGAFLDRDGDGVCSATDPTWGIYGVIADPDRPDVIELDPSKFLLDDPRDVCRHFASD